jgi:hypothetical protein
MLLEEGARVDAKDVAGYTAAHHSCNHVANLRTLQVAIVLAAFGADFSKARTRFGETPVAEAVMS